MKISKLSGGVAVALLVLTSCGPSQLTVKECTDLGGRAVTNPGNGSHVFCPLGEVAIGTLSDTLEGGICCVPET